MASQAFNRFTATDNCNDRFKAQAISIVLSGGLVAAILGPSLVKISLDMDNLEPFLYSYLAIVILNCFGPLILINTKSHTPRKSFELNKNKNIELEKPNVVRPLTTIF